MIDGYDPGHPRKCAPFDPVGLSPPFSPGDVPHSFLVTSEQARFYELVTPDGIECFHLDASEPAPASMLPPAGPPDAARLIAAIGPYDAEIIGPPMGRH
jgi:hypothetical protein